MSKDQFDAAINDLLIPTEIALLNFCIYWNEKHIEYYKAYHTGRFEWCFNYLKKHKSELTMANVPKKWKKQAEYAVASATKDF
jgi:hypothetical protein